MKKISISLIALSMLGASSLSAHAAQIVKIAHGASESFHMHRALVQFKKEVEERTQGKFEIQLFPNSQMGPDREMIENVQSGTLDGCVSPPTFFAQWNPVFNVVDGLPYFYPNLDVSIKVMNSPTGQELLTKLDDMGLAGLGYMLSGVRQTTNNKRPINTPEDFKGIKLRTMKVPAHLETFQALGASPTPMNFGEVYSALQQGVIDGEENPISIIYSQKFHEVQKYLSLDNHIVASYIFVMNGDVFAGLSPENQKIFKEAAANAQKLQHELMLKEDAEQIGKMKEIGVAVNDVSPENLEKFKTATESVRQKYRQSIGADIYDAWSKTIAEHSK